MAIVGSPLVLSGSVIINDSGSPHQNFRVETNTKTHAIFVDSGNEKISFLSGSGITGGSGEDVNFFISGSAGSIGSSTKGSAVFGGDLFVSGALIVSGNQGPGKSYSGGSISGSIHHTAQGKSYLIAGSGITIASSSDGSVTITGTATSAEWTDEGSVLRPNDGAAEDVGIGGTGTPEGNYKFYVDGATGNTKTLGFITASLGFSGSLTRLADGTSYLIAGSNITIASSSNGAVTITSTAGGAGAANQIAYWTDSDTLDSDTDLVFNPSTTLLHFNVGNRNNGSFVAENTNGQVITTDNTGLVLNEEGLPTIDIRAETNLKSHAIFLDGDNQYLHLLADDATPAGGLGTDMSLFVSGGIGSTGGSERGTSVFGGDVAVSGTLVANRSDDGENASIKIDKNYTGTDSVGSIAGTGNDASGLLVDYDVTGIVASGKTAYHDAIAVHYNQDAPTHVGTINATAADIRMTGGTSGTQSMKGVAVRMTGASTNTGIDVAVPPGDTHLIARTTDGAGLDYFKISVDTDGLTTLLTNDAGSSVGHINIIPDGKMLILSGGAGASPNESEFTDINFFLSGTAGSIGTSTPGAALFGGDVVISGSLNGGSPLQIGTYRTDLGTDVTTLFVGNIGGNGKVLFDGDTYSSGSVLALSGLSGSLTRLTNGTSYLVGGSNVTITSASNGQVTIAASGGGTPGGSNTQVQYNNSSNFGGISGVTTDGSAMTFGDSAILVGQDITHDGDSDTKIVFGDDAIGLTVGGVQLVEVTEASQDIVKIGNGGDVDFQVRTNGNNNTIYVRGDNDRVGIGTSNPDSILHVEGDSPTVSIQRDNNSDDSTIAFLGASGFTGAIMHLSRSNDLVFKTHDGSSPHEILRLGGHYASDVRQVILLSGSAMAASSMQPKQSTDINFFASGAIGSKNSGTRGTAVFGGDVVTSGSVYVGDGSSGVRSLNVYANVSGEYAAKIDNDHASSGHVLKLETDGNGSNSRILEMEDGDGDTLFRARADGRFGFGAAGVSSMGAGTFVVGIDGGHTADIAISKRLQHLGDSNTYMDFPAADQVQFVAGDTDMIHMIKDAGGGQVLILSGGAPASTDNAKAIDVSFYVSGSRTKIGTAQAPVTGRNAKQRTNAIFGGDVIFSGSIYGTSELSPGNPAVHMKANTVQFDAASQIVMCDSSGNAPGFGTVNSTDVFYSVSGSKDSKGGVVRGVAVFGGDVVVSGTLSARQKVFTHHAVDLGGTSQEYIPFNGTSPEASPNFKTQMLKSYPGKLKAVVVRAQSAAGSTVVAFHKDTGPGQTTINATPTETQTVNIASAATPYTFTFSSSEYLAGNLVGISIDPSSTPNNTNIICIWEDETYS